MKTRRPPPPSAARSLSPEHEHHVLTFEEKMILSKHGRRLRVECGWGEEVESETIFTTDPAEFSAFAVLFPGLAHLLEQLLGEYGTVWDVLKPWGKGAGFEDEDDQVDDSTPFRYFSNDRKVATKMRLTLLQVKAALSDFVFLADEQIINLRWLNQASTLREFMKVKRDRGLAVETAREISRWARDEGRSELVAEIMDLRRNMSRGRNGEPLITYGPGGLHDALMGIESLEKLFKEQAGRLEEAIDRMLEFEGRPNYPYSGRLEDGERERRSSWSRDRSRSRSRSSTPYTEDRERYDWYGNRGRSRSRSRSAGRSFHRQGATRPPRSLPRRSRFDIEEVTTRMSRGRSRSRSPQRDQHLGSPRKRYCGAPGILIAEKCPGRNVRPSPSYSPYRTENDTGERSPAASAYSTATMELGTTPSTAFSPASICCKPTVCSGRK